MATKLREPAAPDYETDTAGWAEAQAAALTERRVEALDWDNLADEILDMAKHEREKLVSALRILLLHLLKWDNQPELRSRSWWLSIAEHRDRVTDGLDENPSLRSKLAALLAKAYHGARRDAAVEMHVPTKTLPADCPYSFDDLMTRPVEWDGELA